MESEVKVDDKPDDAYDDFFDEAPTIVLIRRLIDEAIAEAEVDAALEEEDFEPTTFRAIGARA